MGLGIEGCRIAFRGTIDRCVEALGGELPALDQQLPCPGDRLLLEIITEGPVSQHLEKGVVVGIESYILEIVVLASCAYALLRISSPWRSVVARGRTEKDRHELVHPGIREEKVGGVGQQTRGRDDGVLLAAEEIEERTADLGGGHGKKRMKEEL